MRNLLALAALAVIVALALRPRRHPVPATLYPLADREEEVRQFWWEGGRDL